MEVGRIVSRRGPTHYSLAKACGRCRKDAMVGRAYHVNVGLATVRVSGGKAWRQLNTQISGVVNRYGAPEILGPSAQLAVVQRFGRVISPENQNPDHDR